ncbi:YHYH protein [Reichenbachiella sp.]|uniref:YHYH protein n=1 Tax=Reichenbachiella sp. TaxID=2184521 RepID=UPI00329A6ADC
MKNVLLIIGLLFFAHMGYSHAGGHAQTRQEPRVWKSVENKVLDEGHFLLAKDQSVYLERKTGEVVSYPLKNLSWVDQKYVLRRIERIAKLNEMEVESVKIPAQKAESSSGYYLVVLYALMGALIIWLLFGNELVKKLKKKKKLLGFAVVCVATVFVVACSDEADEVTSVDDLVSAVSSTDELALAFAPYTNVSTRFDDEYFYVESDGIPDHEMMVGITAWIAQFPVPHPYTGDNAWSIPLNTKYAENPVSIEGELQRGALGIATNGIPIFNPINASGLVSNDIGELDAFGGHSGRGDDYHYHTAPIHLESTSGILPIAYAFDGYPVYGSKEPDGSAMETLDDTFHGHEWSDGSFHYHGTSDYPYMVASLRGEVTLEGTSPQTQITPQAIGQAFRGDPHGINSDDLVITALTENATGNGYTLEYTSQGKQGSVEYSWDANDLYTFIFNDIDGTTTTETFQR